MAVRAVPFTIDGQQLSDFQGKVVVLDFFTYGCINCMNNVCTMERLHHQYGHGVKVIGIHSPKFDHEQESTAIGMALQRLGVTYAVLEDREHTLRDAYAIKAWPTTVVIDEKGYLVQTFTGERKLEDFVPFLGGATPKVERPSPPIERLHFPQKLLCTDAFLAVANTGADSVWLYDYDGQLQHQFIGFSCPMGMAFDGTYLYVANSGDGTIISVNVLLKTQQVVLEGLRNPYDVALKENLLWVAQGGSHQIITYDIIKRRRVSLWGNGFEALRDGPFKSAQLAQPSGVSLLHEQLWFVDAESSSLRYIEQGVVITALGEGLHTFGDDEVGLLQHPQGVVCGQYGDGCGGGRIFIADTYNGKIKVFHPEDRSLMTLVEGLQEPSGISKKGCRLYIADTNAHRIVVFDLSQMMLLSFLPM